MHWGAVTRCHSTLFQQKTSFIDSSPFEALLWKLGLTHKWPQTPWRHTPNQTHEEELSKVAVLHFHPAPSCYRLPYESSEHFYLSLSNCCSQVVAQLGQEGTCGTCLILWKAAGCCLILSRPRDVREWTGSWTVQLVFIQSRRPRHWTQPSFRGHKWSVSVCSCSSTSLIHLHSISLKWFQHFFHFHLNIFLIIMNSLELFVGWRCSVILWCPPGSNFYTFNYFQQHFGLLWFWARSLKPEYQTIIERDTDDDVTVKPTTWGHTHWETGQKTNSYHVKWQNASI